MFPPTLFLFRNPGETWHQSYLDSGVIGFPFIRWVVFSQCSTQYVPCVEKLTKRICAGWFGDVGVVWRARGQEGVHTVGGLLDQSKFMSYI